jgi:CRP-like cAMP-binding protein
MSADLAKVALFKGLDAADQRALGERITVRALPADTTVFVEGDPGDSIWLILKGKVKIFLRDPDGQELIIDVRTAGQYVGEMMLDGSPRSATVKTIEPCEFGVLSRDEFKQVLAQHPDVAMHLIRRLIRLTRGHNVRTLQDVTTRGELQIYIEKLKSSKASDLPSVRRWLAAKRWVLVSLLVFALGQYYFLDVLLEMVSMGGVTVTVNSPTAR